MQKGTQPEVKKGPSWWRHRVQYTGEGVKMLAPEIRDSRGSTESSGERAEGKGRTGERSEDEAACEEEGESEAKEGEGERFGGQRLCRPFTAPHSLAWVQ
jgi:hypothetical protein